MPAIPAFTVEHFAVAVADTFLSINSYGMGPMSKSGAKVLSADGAGDVSPTETKEGR